MAYQPELGSYYSPAVRRGFSNVAKVVNRLTERVDAADASIDTAEADILALEALTTPSTWTAPTLTNSWVDFDANRPAQYRKVGDIVYLRGVIKDGTIDTPAFTLPSGFRPAFNNEEFAVQSNATFGSVRVAFDGAVTPLSACNNAWVWLSGIQFSTTA